MSDKSADDTTSNPTNPPSDGRDRESLSRGAGPLTFDLSVPTSTQTAESSDPEPSEPVKKTGVAGALAAIGILVWKFKAVAIAVLLKLKSVFVLFKFGKVFTSLSTMILSIGVYSMEFGWKFATLFVLLIFVHEMGHVLVAWQKKVPVTAPMFIPFMGAFIGLKQNPQDALTEAQIGYGGPLFGAIGDTVAWGIFYLTGNPVFLAAANISMMINLFNLAPVSPLDGGRIVAAISPKIWLLGLVLMTFWFLSTHSPIMLIVIVLGGIRLVSQWTIMHTDEYFKVSTRDRIITSILYIGLAVYLAGCHAYTHEMLMGMTRRQVF